MENTASVTALMSAFGRAYHAETESAPIFADTFAKRLMSGEEYRVMSAYVLGGMDFFAPERQGTFANNAEALRYLVNTQIAPTPLARARYCEERLRRAAAEKDAGAGTEAGEGEGASEGEPVEQYVILGAGLDTFAFREPAFLARGAVFEVDHPLTQADKQARIRRAGLTVPRALRFVPADFATDDLCTCLTDAGFDRTKTTFFSWLGVSYYLPAEHIEHLLDRVAVLAAAGSLLVFDYADEGLFTSGVKRVQNMLAMAVAGGEPMKTCFSRGELERMLETHGFTVDEVLTPPDIQARYFADMPPWCTAFEHISYVTARRTAPSPAHAPAPSPAS